MALRIYGPRKRRTREHVIADQGVHHLEGFILGQGYVAERISRDYGYDLVMVTFDEQGYAEPDLVWFQVKASDSLHEVTGRLVHDLDVRDLALWRSEKLPVILVLFDATSKIAYWLDIKSYFREKDVRRPRKGARQVRVYFPRRQRLDQQAIEHFRRLKAAGGA